MSTGSTTRSVTLTVNGRRVQEEVAARITLADFLRDQLGLTGTHLGCEHGVCGACTVLYDGLPVRSCLMLAAQADGGQVVTIEGLDAEPSGPVLKEQFQRHHALQCGFCTPGILTTMSYFLRDAQHPPTDAEIREALSGNLCRCTGYQNIIEAVKDAAQAMEESS